MIINFITRIFSTKKPNSTQKQEEKAEPEKYPNLAPLSEDTVTLTEEKPIESTIEKPIKTQKTGNTQKVKKSDFDEVGLYTVEKFRVNISQFKTPEDLQEWAKEKIKTDYIEKDFGGRQEETKTQRKAMMKEWVDYVTQENDAYTPVMQLLILDAVTKDLKPKNDNIPDVLNKGILADTMCETLDRIKQNPKEIIDIHKLYKTKLQNVYFGNDENGKIKTDYTGWIVIPSKEHDPENFKENVDKLKTLSHKNWCTKSFNAEPYLSDGDFHVYLENGEPKIGVRFVGDKIQEIQGAKNNSKIPNLYFDEVKKHIEESNLQLRENAQKEIETAEKVRVKIEELKEKIGEEAIQNSDIEKILPFFGIEVEKDEDGFYTISNYDQPSKDFNYSDLGIDENKMFEKVKRIKHYANFYYSDITELKNLEVLEENADFFNSKIKDLNNLREIKGNARFSYSEITNLNNLEYVGGDLSIRESKITDLGKLQTVGGNFDAEKSLITNLGNLKLINGDANFRKTNIESLGKLEKIGGNADFEYSKLKDLGNLKIVDGDANFKYTDIESLNNLETVNGSLNIRCTKVKNLDGLKNLSGGLNISESDVESLGNIERIHGPASFTYCHKLKSLGKLKEIGTYADFSYSGIEDLGELEKIGTSLILNNCKIKSLGKLKELKGSIIAEKAQIDSFGELETIKEELDLRRSKVKDFGKLKTIGKDASFTLAEIESLGQLQSIGGDVRVEKPREGESPTLALLKDVKIGGEIEEVLMDSLI